MCDNRNRTIQNPPSHQHQHQQRTCLYVCVRVCRKHSLAGGGTHTISNNFPPSRFRMLSNIYVIANNHTITIIDYCLYHNFYIIYKHNLSPSSQSQQCQ